MTDGDLSFLLFSEEISLNFFIVGLSLIIALLMLVGDTISFFGASVLILVWLYFLPADFFVAVCIMRKRWFREYCTENTKWEEKEGKRAQYQESHPLLGNDGQEIWE